MNRCRKLWNLSIWVTIGSSACFLDKPIESSGNSRIFLQSDLWIRATIDRRSRTIKEKIRRRVRRRNILFKHEKPKKIWFTGCWDGAINDRKYNFLVEEIVEKYLRNYLNLLRHDLTSKKNSFSLFNIKKEQESSWLL